MRTTNNLNVNVSASIAIYAQQGSNLSQQQLNQAASTIQSSIQNAWSGSFTQDGVTYNVSTQVSVRFWKPRRRDEFRSAECDRHKQWKCERDRR